MCINASKLEREKSKLSPDAARCAEENSTLTKQVSADIRTMSYLFHPPFLDETGLHSALKWYVEGFAERSKIAAELDLAEDGERLPQDYELCLFRIAQECLTNIHRHSGSSTALIFEGKIARSVVRKTRISENYEGRISHICSEISRFSSALE
jgi:two-component system, NarL family, sensor kinase